MITFRVAAITSGLVGAVVHYGLSSLWRAWSVILDPLEDVYRHITKALASGNHKPISAAIIRTSRGPHRCHRQYATPESGVGSPRDHRERKTDRRWTSREQFSRADEGAEVAA